ncbi:MAG TPA: Lrp/AsnC ligand binding domain-containing protein [Candidatus Nanoarchaeia archaeon]|nr:Lrp/AsnC ligand binding domain-containing protein [Candidatus Nanoarchaeia archaeon]
MLTYVLIVSKAGLRERVYTTIKRLGPVVDRLHRVAGEFDLLTALKTASEEKMKESVNKVREMEGVVTLKTYTVFHKTKAADIVPQST